MLTIFNFVFFILIAVSSTAHAMQQKLTYASVAAKGHLEQIKQQEIEKQKKKTELLLQRIDRLNINDCYGSGCVEEARIYIAQNRQKEITFKAFCIAEYDQYHELFKILLDAGADPNYKFCEDDPISRDSIFNRACRGDVQVSKNARLLLARGAKPQIIGKIRYHYKPPLVDWLVALGNEEEKIYEWGPELHRGLP